MRLARFTLENLGYVKQSQSPLVYIDNRDNTSIMITDYDVTKRYASSELPLTLKETLAVAHLIEVHKPIK